MISSWIGYPLFADQSQQSSTHSQSPAVSGSAYPRVTAESLRPRCSRRRTPPVNRRDAKRSDHRAEITLDLLLQGTSRRRSLKAEVMDAAEGGLCVTLNRSLTLSSVIRCRFMLAGTPVGVPTLLQVRWVKQMPTGLYRCGLMYLV